MRMKSSKNAFLLSLKIVLEKRAKIKT